VTAAVTNVVPNSGALELEISGALALYSSRQVTHRHVGGLGGHGFGMQSRLSAYRTEGLRLAQHSNCPVRVLPTWQKSIAARTSSTLPGIVVKKYTTLQMGPIHTRALLVPCRVPSVLKLRRSHIFGTGRMARGLTYI